MSKIRPIHFSIRQTLAKGIRVRPARMSVWRGASREQIEALHSISMSIFVDCTNCGVPFQEAIAAVYLSGLEHGASATRPLQNKGGGE